MDITLGDWVIDESGMSTYTGTLTYTAGSITTTGTTITLGTSMSPGSFHYGEPFTGQIEYDMAGKTLKVFNGVEWISIAMQDPKDITSEEVIHMNALDQIKKEIYG